MGQVPTIVQHVSCNALHQFDVMTSKYSPCIGSGIMPLEDMIPPSFRCRGGIVFSVMT